MNQSAMSLKRIPKTMARSVLGRTSRMTKTFPSPPFSNFSSLSSSVEEAPFEFSKISFIGCGKMAEALIAPLISSGLQPPSRMSLFDVSPSTLDHVSSQYGIPHTTTSISECVKDSELIVCAVKPQNCDVVFKELKAAGNKEGTILSVIAGKPISSFLRDSGFEKVARSMPNTPAQIGKGVTVWTCTENVQLQERARIKKILCSFGKALYVDDEKFIDMATSISGSGPAYIFLLMEAMIDAGVHMGFSRDTATLLVQQTILGSTLYAIETKEHPAILKNSVTSSAGTTASAIFELENGKFRTVVQEAIWSCYRRSLEMGGHSSNVGPGRYTQNISMTPSGECIDTDNDDASSESKKK